MKGEAGLKGEKGEPAGGFHDHYGGAQGTPGRPGPPVRARTWKDGLLDLKFRIYSSYGVNGGYFYYRDQEENLFVDLLGPLERVMMDAQVVLDRQVHLGPQDHLSQVHTDPH